MEFCDVFPHSQNKEVKWVDDNLALVYENKVLVRNWESMQLTAMIDCGSTSTSQISHMEWSPDNVFVACLIPKNTQIQVHRILDVANSLKSNRTLVSTINYSSTIALNTQPNSTPTSLHMMWSPDSNWLLLIDDVCVKIQIWRVTRAPVECAHIIKSPKSIATCTFHHSGKLFACVENRNGSDWINIFSTDHWKLLRTFQCDSQLNDMNSLQWHADQCLVAYQSGLDFNFSIISPITGHVLQRFRLTKQQTQSQTQEPQKVRDVSINQASQLGVCNLGDRFILFNRKSCRAIQTIFPTQENFNKTTTVLQEISSGESTFNTKYDPIPFSKIDLSMFSDVNSTKNSIVRWCQADKQLISFVFSQFPSIVWVWNIFEMRPISILIQQHPVQDLKWDPTSVRLIISCGFKTLYCWTPKTSFMVQVPHINFKIESMRFFKNGKAIALIDSAKMTCCYDPTDE